MVEQSPSGLKLPPVSSVVLCSVADGCVEAVSHSLSVSFGVKLETAQSVVAAAPIIILADLNDDELATLLLALRPLQHVGAELSFGPPHNTNLPKIDWPKQPAIYRQNISDLVAVMDLSFDTPAGNLRLIDLLRNKLHGNEIDDSPSGYRPIVTIPPASGALSSSDSSSLIAAAEQQATKPPGDATRRRQYTGRDLGEITPFSNSVLPSSGSYQQPGTSPTPVPAPDNQPMENDFGARMDELFPSDDDDFLPNTKDVTDILNRIMPDDEPVPTPSTGNNMLSQAQAQNADANAANGSVGGGAFSLFLAKIADPARREKAIPILQDLANIDAEEAGSLAKKVIIPVLRGVSREQAEIGKSRFAEIGVLARIKTG